MSGECDKCGEHTLDCINSKRIELSNSALSYRTCSVLNRCGVYYVDELIQLSSRELIQWKNFGKKALNDVRKFLQSYNLSLKDECINPDIQKVILTDLPETLNAIKAQVDEAIKELRYLSDKIEQISIASTKKTEKLKRNE